MRLSAQILQGVLRSASESAALQPASSLLPATSACITAAVAAPDAPPAARAAIMQLLTRDSASPLPTFTAACAAAAKAAAQLAGTGVQRAQQPVQQRGNANIGGSSGGRGGDAISINGGMTWRRSTSDNPSDSLPDNPPLLPLLLRLTATGRLHLSGLSSP